MGGYKIAIRARSQKTILVEGKDDKDLFNRLKISIGADNAIIDSSDILDDPILSGLGAKARIDQLISQLTPDSPVAEKLWCFVDREWEELIDPLTLDPLPWSQPILTDVRLKTAGHSIENYGFCIDFVTSYLKHYGQGVATEQMLAFVSSAVPGILAAGAAFSEVARKKSILGRCSDILDINDILWDGHTITFQPSIEQKLKNRGCVNTHGFLAEVEQTRADKWAASPFAEEAHLHAHGHIGEAILWIGIGRMVVESGIAENIGREIATGRREEKRRVWHGWLSGLSSNSVKPLHQAFY